MVYFSFQVIYNFERIMYLMSNMDTALVKKMQEDYEEGAVTPDVVVEKVVFVTLTDLPKFLNYCLVFRLINYYFFYKFHGCICFGFFRP